MCEPSLAANEPITVIPDNATLEKVRSGELSIANGNKIIFESKNSIVNLIGSKINFLGENNILYIGGEGTLRFKKSAINLKGSNSLACFCCSKNAFYGNLHVMDNCFFSLGKSTFISPYGDKIKIIVAEGKHILIGDDCLFSNGISMRSSDAHALYDLETLDRINPSKSILVGDHVWLGERCRLLKGSIIQSGATVGAHAVVAGKTVTANSAYAGNPAKLVRENVTWEKPGVNLATPDDLIQRQKAKDVFDFRDNPLPSKFINTLKMLDSLGSSTAQQKLDIWLNS